MLAEEARHNADRHSCCNITFLCLFSGVRTMAKAYVNTPTNHQKESLNNVKCGFKECTQVRLFASETQT